MLICCIYIRTKIFDYPFKKRLIIPSRAPFESKAVCHNMPFLSIRMVVGMFCCHPFYGNLCLYFDIYLIVIM